MDTKALFAGESAPAPARLGPPADVMNAKAAPAISFGEVLTQAAGATPPKAPVATPAPAPLAAAPAALASPPTFGMNPFAGDANAWARHEVSTANPARPAMAYHNTVDLGYA